MNCKLVAGLACGMILLLGACSGNPPPPGTSTTPTPPPPDGEDMTGVENAQLTAAKEAITKATDKVTVAEDALTAVGESNTEENRATARAAIKEAIDELDKAEKEVTRIFGDAENAALREALYAELRKIRGLKETDTKRLRMEEVPLFWFNRALVRQTIANGKARLPADATNVAAVTPTNRTKRTSETVATQIANTAAGVIKSTDLTDAKAPMYSANKKVFSNSGDEFVVGGYVSGTTSEQLLDISLKTGLKLTGSGLEIRSGGAVGSGTGINAFTGDYLDMRKKIDTSVGTGISSGGRDLLIKLDSPVPVSAPATDGGVSSWTGNGDFYWRAIAPAGKDHLDATKTAYYTASTYTQPLGFKDLGTYEVWLSNHIGRNQRLEPTENSGVINCPDGTRSDVYGGTCPSDDLQEYLDYAAYGMFVFMPDAAVGAAIPTDRGRIQSMHFGYEAFKDETGKKTQNINEAVSGTFRGQTIATAFKGNRVPGGTTGATDLETRLLRGDVELMVNIPKTSGSGDLIGTISNFAQWTGSIWNDYSDDFKVSFDNGTASQAITITDGGTFTGTARLAVGTTDPFTIAATNDAGVGQVTGKFYGPRTDTALEIAGSWVVGHATASPTNDDEKWKIIGSFGAKQRPRTSAN